MNKKKLGVYINFIGSINEKISSLLISLLTEQLSSGVKLYRINISSVGDIVFYAASLFNFISGLKDVIVNTHNIRQTDSTSNLLFFSGTKRIVNRSFGFFLHSLEIIIQSQIPLFLEFLKEKVEGEEKDELKMAKIIFNKINKNIDEILKMFKERKTYSAQESKKSGFILDIKDSVGFSDIPIYTITN